MRRTMKLFDEDESRSLNRSTLLRAVCEDIAENIKANRVSIWRFDENNTKIVCECYMTVDKQEFSEGQTLNASDAPEYFKTILEEKYVEATDARDHSATRELTEIYFEPADIYSLLDFIIHKNFSPVGIICCENAYEKRDWTEEDKSYLRQISTLFSFK